METAYIALGGNLGDPLATLRAALARLDERPGVRVAASSTGYRTAPLGLEDQPPFLNAVARLETTLEPRDLLATLLDVEAGLGRVRVERYGPRTCDLDLLLYGDRVIDEPDLQVPHPRLTERRFVLEPLAELAPDLRLPDGRSVDGLLPGVASQEVRPLGLRLR